MSEANSGMAAKPIQFIRPGVIRQGARTSRFSEWIENFFVRHRDKLVWLHAAMFVLFVAVTQPLYRPGNAASFEQGKKSVALAQAQLAGAEQDLIVRVSQAYFDVLASNDTLQFVKAQKTAVAEQLASAKRNFEVGTSTLPTPAKHRPALTWW